MSVSVGRAGAGLRLLRAAVFAAVCVALSAAGHGLAACAAVPWWTLLAAFLGVLAVAVALAGRERSLPSIAAALAGGQLALHIVFGVGTHTATAGTGAGPGDDALIRFAASIVCGAGPAQLNAAEARDIVSTAGIDPATVASGAHQHLAAGPSGPLSALSGTLPSLPMLLGHLLAALATGWLLRRGEVALFRIARLSAHGAQQLAAGARLRALRDAFRLVAALRAGLGDVPETGPRIPRTVADAPRPATGDTLQHMVIRRGPPSVLALAA
ncbi:hypothetical protein MHW47_11850 [Streptomyces sp. OfavH-34-F]|uniref:hypothetical protein n=1 Tax=Streptomyces sp. OfavH-34-F TaxID=2917760 RepID=UPI001EF37A18|nr:hypothetical protein [Streptomyces sp. OfavH-34-F]MCG7525129.1 hypothetical protein [Streptomyces sp. OfavH-34-F]